MLLIYIQSFTSSFKFFFFFFMCLFFFSVFSLWSPAIQSFFSQETLPVTRVAKIKKTCQSSYGSSGVNNMPIRDRITSIHIDSQRTWSYSELYRLYWKKKCYCTDVINRVWVGLFWFALFPEFWISKNHMDTHAACILDLDWPKTHLLVIKPWENLAEIHL